MVNIGDEKIIFICTMIGSIRCIHVKQDNLTKIKETFFKQNSMMINSVDELVCSQIKIIVANLGISWIGLKKKKERIEAIYILLKGVEAVIIEDQTTIKQQLSIKNLVIDNNTFGLTPFKVLLTPTKPRE